WPAVLLAVHDPGRRVRPPRRGAVRVPAGQPGHLAGRAPGAAPDCAGSAVPGAGAVGHRLARRRPLAPDRAAGGGILAAQPPLSGRAEEFCAGPDRGGAERSGELAFAGALAAPGRRGGGRGGEGRRFRLPGHGAAPGPALHGVAGADRSAAPVRVQPVLRHRLVRRLRAAGPARPPDPRARGRGRAAARPGRARRRAAMDPAAPGPAPRRRRIAVFRSFRPKLPSPRSRRRSRHPGEAPVNSAPSSPNPTLSRRPFLLGVFLITYSVLVFQIVQTRVLSVIAWYYLAFFAISVAMLGMTAGAVWVYLHRERFTPGRLA